MTEAELLLDFGDGLRRTMKRKNITCHGLARRTGLRRENICRYRRGEHFPQAKNLSAILTALNVNLYELMRPEE